MTDGFNQMNQAETPSNRKVGDVGQPCSQPKEAAWIEIELIDDRDEPVPNEPYWIKLPDEQIREGNLDQTGFVRIDGIEPGTCLVKFPGIDAADWQLPAQESPLTETADEADEKAWIEIELLDEDDRPVPDEPYWIKLPNGEIREGRLDQTGCARLEGIDPGTCAVKFPGIDANDIEKE